MDVKLGFSILWHPLKNWSGYPVPYLEEIRYMWHTQHYDNYLNETKVQKNWILAIYNFINKTPTFSQVHNSN